MAERREEQVESTPNTFAHPPSKLHPTATNKRPSVSVFRAGSQNIDAMQPGSKSDRNQKRFLDENGSVLVEHYRHALAVQCFAEVFPQGFVERYGEVGGGDAEKMTGLTALELLWNARARLEVGKREAMAQQEVLDMEENLTLAKRAWLQLYLRMHWE